jgi:hypothetical protein
MNRAFLIESVTDQCAACTKNDSVFKKTFDMAGQGLANLSGNLSISNGAPSLSVGSPSAPK